MLMVNIFYTAMTSLYGMNMYFAKYVMQDAGYNKTMMMCSTFASILVPLLLIPVVQKIGKRNVALYGGAGMGIAGQKMLTISMMNQYLFANRIFTPCNKDKEDFFPVFCSITPEPTRSLHP